MTSATWHEVEVERTYGEKPKIGSEHRGIRVTDPDGGYRVRFSRGRFGWRWSIVGRTGGDPVRIEQTGSFIPRTKDACYRSVHRAVARRLRRTPVVVEDVIWPN